MSFSICIICLTTRNVIIRKIRYLSTLHLPYIIIYHIPAKYSAEIYKFIQVIHRRITQEALKSNFIFR